MSPLKSSIGLIISSALVSVIVVIVRLSTADYNASTVTGTHTTTTIGSDTAITWSSNGTLVTP